MNIVEEFRRDESRVLDRLVDGELSTSQRRELLAALDDEPGAWRRCALAFLEAQSWRWQMGRLAAEPIVAQASSVRSSPVSDRASRRATFWSQCLAVAAGLLVAFGAGVTWQRSGVVREMLPTSQAVIAGRQVDDTPLDFDDFDALPQTVRLSWADENGRADEIDLPVSSGDEGDDTWFDTRESAVAASLIEKLEQAGFQIDKQQSLLPVNLSDGRELVVPVEQFYIHNPELARF